MSRKAIFCAATLVASTLAESGVAQQRPACSDRQSVLARLAEGYGESRQSVALGANNSVFEVYASQETGTWTILVTLPTGISCLIASGEAYEALPGEALAVRDRDA